MFAHFPSNYSNIAQLFFGTPCFRNNEFNLDRHSFWSIFPASFKTFRLVLQYCPALILLGSIVKDAGSKININLVSPWWETGVMSQSGCHFVDWVWTSEDVIWMYYVRILINIIQNEAIHELRRTGLFLLILSQGKINELYQIMQNKCKMT